MSGGQPDKTLKIVNSSGNLQFNSAADLRSNCNEFNINATDRFKIESSAESLIRCVSGNANVEVNSGHLNLISKQTNSNLAVFINASETGAGIYLKSGYGGITHYSTGNV